MWSAASLAAAIFYFQWLLQPERAGVIALFVLLIIADLFNGFHAVSFWLTSVRRRKERPFETPDEPPRVDVLIPTLNEDRDILEPTIRAAKAMRGARVTVHVLDDGDRPEIEHLAAELDVRYIGRRNGRGAKAGNINNALRITREGGADLVCVFDSDHVPHANFLEATLGYFTEPRVALVQTPQVYRNVEDGWLTRGAAEQQAIFFGPICTGRDAFDATFCCGTNFVVRRSALQAVDGFPEDSVTEDIVLSAKLSRLGYELVYTPEKLSEGLGPADARSYVSQQTRWATGCLELLLRRRSLWGGLTAAQRWQYFMGTSYWLVGWTLAIYISLPIMRLLFGWQPIGDSASEFAVHFLPYFLLAVLNLGRLSLGSYSFIGLALTWGSFLIHIRATVAVLRRAAHGFVVTPKVPQATSAWRPFAGNLLVGALLVMSIVVAIVRDPSAATFNNVTFAIIDLLLISSAAVFAVQQQRRERNIAPAASQQPVADPA